MQVEDMIGPIYRLKEDYDSFKKGTPFKIIAPDEETCRYSTGYKKYLCTCISILNGQETTMFRYRLEELPAKDLDRNYDKNEIKRSYILSKISHDEYEYLLTITNFNIPLSKIIESLQFPEEDEGKNVLIDDLVQSGINQCRFILIHIVNGSLSTSRYSYVGRNKKRKVCK